MKRFIPLALLCAAGVAAGAFAQVPENKPCITYWSVGDSACGGGETSQPTPSENQAALPKRTLDVPQPPMPRPQASEPSLERKVDTYMRDYGKPPREFVAFNLEPTVENALRWVQKYEEMLRRERDVADAWEKASVVYGQLTPEQRAEVLGSAPEELPQPNFTGFLSEGAQTTPPNPFAEQEDAETGSNANTMRRSASVGPGGRLTLGSASPLEVTYYYNAECEVCARFEVNLRDALLTASGQYALSCVDVSDSAAPAPLSLSLECTPRLALPGELGFLKVNTVPSVLMSADAAGSSSELLRGYKTRKQLEETLQKQVEALYR